ncbi:hypothetical protein DFH07DRAFT_809525 [Mycena maculata]|uniref:F-box domain-containing protein n=1 Tax=Mycena maculata TaxID=230809 RepID=A0AAD7NLR4_9AGAR|nr:hypothetical protein DFH07DRAFT_809525 [Mycena maculata]
MIFGLLSKLLKAFLPTISTPERHPLTVTDVPTDILDLVFETLLDLEAAQQPYGHELCNSACLIPLSETCRYMRTVALPWIFREVYNWRRDGVDVWPDTLWRFFRTVHMRDRSVRHPSQIRLTPQVYCALPKMQALTKVTLRLHAAIPVELLSTLSLVRGLSVLEIHQVRFDGPPPPDNLSFPSLSSLLIGICGFQGVTRVPNIDHDFERHNVATLLRSLSHCLTRLHISGDLLSPQFCELFWRKLQLFTVTEHTPTPFIPIPQLVAQMPALQSLAVLFTADLSRDRNDVFPPFRLGIMNGDLLTNLSPHLTSVSLSNMEHNDPIFGQLSSSLESLHLLPMRDLYTMEVPIPASLREVRFYDQDAFIVLEHISHLDRLTDLSFTLIRHPPSPDLIRAIALKFPMLRCLQLGYFVRRQDDLYLVELRDAALFESLRLVQHLRHLKLSLDIYWSSADRGPPAHAAYLLMQELPNLQTVSYRWRHYHTAAPDIWHTWDRSLLLHSPPPQLPKKIPEIELVRADTAD